MSFWLCLTSDELLTVNQHAVVAPPHRLVFHTRHSLTGGALGDNDRAYSLGDYTHCLPQTMQAMGDGSATDACKMRCHGLRSNQHSKLCKSQFGILKAGEHHAYPSGNTQRSECMDVGRIGSLNTIEKDVLECSSDKALSNPVHSPPASKHLE